MSDTVWLAIGIASVLTAVVFCFMCMDCDEWDD